MAPAMACISPAMSCRFDPVVYDGRALIHEIIQTNPSGPSRRTTIGGMPFHD